MFNLHDFITNVEYLLAKQKEFYATPKEKRDLRNLLLKEVISLEQNVELMIELYHEAGQTDVIDQPRNEKGSQDN